MTKFFLSASTLILGLVFSHIVTAQNPETAEKARPTVFQVAVNGKPMQFDQGVIMSFTVKEDGSLTITAQTTTDILNTNIIALNITPTETSKKITKGEYKILPDDAVTTYLVRAEYYANTDGNSSYWWSNAAVVKGGSIIIDEITDTHIKGKFSFTGVFENEDGSMNAKNLVKVTKGRV
jgi:hypothetical protein